ncbi:U1 putative protein [Ouango virus]|uniref:Uncharacterized protein n=1 Tax=Ouango virus TaxID=864692 RepID=A0AAE9BMI2_9RHAB|nr:U1 putative protein [Ouango virus]UAV25682.1 U1 putative protein [Ouango virus]
MPGLFLPQMFLGSFKMLHFSCMQPEKVWNGTSDSLRMMRLQKLECLESRNLVLEDTQKLKRLEIG